MRMRGLRSRLCRLLAMPRSFRQPLSTSHDSSFDDEDEPLLEGWAEGIDPDALDYLYSESRLRLIDLREAADRQLRKVLFIAAAATFAIGTTGLLERWRFDFSASPFTSTCSAGALVAWFAILVLWVIALLPRERHIGVSPVWLAHSARRGRTTPALKSRTVEVQVLAFTQNLRHNADAERRVTWATRFVALEVALLVLAELLRAAGGVPSP